MTDLYYATLLGFSGFVSLFVAGIAWRRRPVPGASGLFAFMLALCFWSCMYAIFWLVPTRADKLFWLSLAYMGVMISPGAFLVMVLQFTGYAHWLSGRIVIILGIPAAVVLLSLWTDPWFGYFFGNVDYTNPEFYLKGGAGFWLGVLYSYLVTFSAVCFLIHAYWRSTSLRRDQVGDAPMGREAVVEILEDSVLVIDTQNRVVDLNPMAKTFMDQGSQNPIGKPIEQVFSEWLRASGLDLDLSQARFQIKVNKAGWRYYDITISPMFDRNNTALGRLILWRDITVQKKTEEEFQKFYFAVEHSNASIVITDTDSRIEYANPYFSQITGYDIESVRGKTPQIFKSGETPDAVYKSLWEAIKSGKEWGGEMLNKKLNGELFWEYNRISLVKDSQGNVTHYLAIKEDITERKKKDEELRDANLRLQAQLNEIESLHAKLQAESIRDRLTGLFNRKFMEETLEREIAMAFRMGTVLSLVIMDVDRFKTVNDTYGHQAGDMVIKKLGEFLLQNTRSGDMACRFGGDEIVVVMPNATIEDACQRAEEWRKTFVEMTFVFGNQSFSTSLTQGVAAFPVHAASSYDLLNVADKALYFAKTRRNIVCAYDPASMAGPPS